MQQDYKCTCDNILMTIISCCFAEHTRHHKKQRARRPLYNDEVLIWTDAAFCKCKARPALSSSTRRGRFRMNRMCELELSDSPCPDWKIMGMSVLCDCMRFWECSSSDRADWPYHLRPQRILVRYGVLPWAIRAIGSGISRKYTAR